MNIAAVDRQAAFAIDGEEGAGAGDLGLVIDDRSILEGGQRGFDLANPFVNLIGILLGLGIFGFERSIFGREGVEGRLFLVRQGRGRADQPAQAMAALSLVLCVRPVFAIR